MKKKDGFANLCFRINYSELIDQFVILIIRLFKVEVLKLFNVVRNGVILIKVQLN